MERKILIVYYSYSGNTKKLAQLIQQKVGGKLCEIQPEELYPSTYDAVVEQAKKEIKTGFLPTIKTTVEKIEMYDTIFIGSPNWWSTIAPPMATFLKNHDVSGKTIVPFCTHGGGGFGRIEQDVRKLCTNSTVTAGLSVYRSENAESLVSLWLDKLELFN